MEYESGRPAVKRKLKLPGRRTVARILIAILIILLGAGVYMFFSRTSGKAPFFATRAMNTFSFLVLGRNPHFYYILMEKNGKDYPLTAKDTFELTYRDEFVVKSIISDDLLEKGIAVDVEGLGDKNDFRKLLKGIELIDALMAVKKSSLTTGRLPEYHINVSYRDRLIAQIPMKVVITPQDLLRYAKNSEDQRLQADYLRQAIAANREDTQVRKMLAAVYCRQGKTREAIALYKEVLDRKPDDATAMSELLKCYMNGKDYEQVVKTGAMLLRINRQDAATFANVAFALGKLNQWDRAIANYREAVRLNPDNAILLYRLGEAFEKSGKINDAASQYRTYLAKVPKADYAMIALADVSLKAGHTDEAIKWYREALKKQPRNAAIYANLGLAYQKKGLVKEEIASYRRAIALNPKEPVVQLNLAAALAKNKQDGEAAKIYRKFGDQKTGDADAVERLANLEYKARRYPQAIQLYEQIVAKSKRKAMIHANLGFAYGELKKLNPSLENYEKAIKYGNKDPQTLYNLAYTYGKLGKTKEALGAYEQYAAVRPTADVLNTLSDSYIRGKQYDKAIATYQKMLPLLPKKAPVYANLGHAYSLQGNQDKAVEFYKLSLRHDPEDDMVYLRLGEAYEKKQMYSEALNAYRSAYELNSDSKKAAEKFRELKIRMLQQKNREG
jgi:tetratricopeptide (TPR) repeat protein